MNLCDLTHTICVRVGLGAGLRTLHTKSEMFVCIFFLPYLSSFAIKMLATDTKMQKIEPDPNFFITDERFGGSV